MARARSTPPHCCLPEDIFIWEILVRLPPKSLLRSCTVCWSWRRATSTPDFLLAHHVRQPSLPLLDGYDTADGDERSMDIIPYDHRAGLDQLQSVARLRGPNASPVRKASSDGILIVSFSDTHFTVCNPVTRQHARLEQLDGFRLLGMYMHSPTHAYRVLLYPGPRLMGGELDGSYVFTLGAGKPPRHIGYPDAKELLCTNKYVQFRGNLHWCISLMIMVFDTITESFRQIRAPAVLSSTAPVAISRADLFEMDDKMGVSSYTYAQRIIDIWVLQDYEGEEWTYKCRVELPAAELRLQFNIVQYRPSYVEVVSSYGDVFLLVKFGDWLLHVDINGKVVASFRRTGLYSTQLQIRQTLVSHSFFRTLEGYLVNASPFI